MSYDFEAVAANFAAAGIQSAFGITGSGNSLTLINALQQQGISYYPAQHEAAAALMAGAACFEGSTRALAISIKGPGFANMVPGILSNQYEGRPALTVSEAYARDANPWQMHKRLDHWSLSRDLVKGCMAMDAGGQCIGPLVTAATSEYPGPCHIELGAKPAVTRVSSLSATAPGASGVLGEVLDRISAASKPMVILGSWALRRHGNAAWSKLTIPVATTAAAKGCMDETSDYSAGIVTGEISALSAESGVMRDADLVIGFGLRNAEVVKAVPCPCPLVTIDEIPLQSPGGFAPAYQFNQAAESDIAKILDALADCNWGAEQIATQRAARDQCILADNWQVGNVMRITAETLRSNSHDPRLVLDTGFFCTVGETVWSCRKPGDFVASSVGRFMGTSLPTAIGLAASDRTRPVVCFAGDGGIAPYIAELHLAVREKLPLLVASLSDGGYGSVAAFAAADAATRRAVETGSGNWWRVAAALGAEALPVADDTALHNALDQWQPDQGPLFLEMSFEPQRYREIAKQIR